MYTVFIVDDEPLMCEYARTFIPWRELGFQVSGTAGSGQAALDALEHTPLDVLLTDIRMPGMDGIALAVQMRNLHPRTKVVLLTAHEDFDYARAAIQNGAFGYLLKSDTASECAEYFRSLHEVLTLEERQGTRNAPLRDQGGLLPLALNYLEQHFREDISLAQLGQVLHVHSVHLSRVFTQRNGMSYHEVVSELRQTEAMRLLRETNLPINQVAEQVGYPRSSYFSEWFKRRTGLTPQAFREGRQAP